MTMRRTATTLLAVLALLSTATVASAQRWKYPPGPVYRPWCSTDTLRIYDLQLADTVLARCHPATLDTVLGVRGIITAFDAKPSAFGFYIQNTFADGPHLWTGVKVFTGATNYSAAPYSLAVGDSIAVYGTTQEFPNPNGETEIEGPDVIQSTNDILIRKINAGNALPPAHVGTTAEFNWVPGISAATAEPWEGCLVRINYPLKVARTSMQDGRPTLPFSSFLVVSSSSPGDSTLIDGNSLATFTPPAVGTSVDSIQGIVNQATTTGTNSYRLQLRNANDIFISTPPNLVDAYPVEDNILRLQFDRNVDVTSAQSTANYGLASGPNGSTVNVATVEGGAGPVVRLQITSVRIDGDIDTVSAVNVGSESCPTCVMSPQQRRTFVNGVLTCATVQAPDPAKLASYDDRSRFAGAGTAPGTRLSVRAVAVGQYGNRYYLNDGPPTLRGGIAVYGPLAPLTIAHQYLIAGQAREFGSETEIVSNVYLVDEGPVSEPTPPIEVVAVLKDTTTDWTQTMLTGEDYEGVRVKIMKHVMVTEWRATGQSFHVAGPTESGSVFTDTILVSNLNDVLDAYAPPDSGSVIDVTGALHFADGAFSICPRSAAEIVNLGPLGVPSGDPATLEFSTYPNPARVLSVRFALPRRGDLDIGAYDVAGRRVATIAKGAFGAGVHAREWNGLDASGRSAATGVYFIRLRFGSETRVARTVVLK
jgi:hypothetical protein